MLNILYKWSNGFSPAVPAGIADARASGQPETADMEKVSPRFQRIKTPAAEPRILVLSFLRGRDCPVRGATRRCAWLHQQKRHVRWI